MKERFPITLDNTMISTFASCPMKFYNEHILGLSGEESIHLIAGGAFAKAVETTRREFYSGRDPLDAIALGARALILEYGDADTRTGADDPSSKLYPKSFDRVLDAFLTYFDLLPLPQNCARNGIHALGTEIYVPARIGERLGVEFSAVLPLGIQHPDTGDELTYSIRFDAICDSPYGLVGLDEKTGSQLPSNWAQQWNLRSQFLNYIKVVQLLGIPMQGMVVRGAILQKTQFHFPEALVLPPQAVVDRCWEDTMHRVELMLHYYKHNHWPSNFASACLDYGLCPFHDLCQVADPADWYDGYNISYWDPVSAKRIWVRKIELPEGIEL